MNKWLGVGRITKDIELKYGAASQTAVCRFSVAIDDGYGDKKKTNFINVIAFGKTAEACERYTGKGLRVAVEGKISTDSYEKDGKKVYTTDIIAERVEFIDWKSNDGGQLKAESPFDEFAALSDECPF